jgi:hypothetical protein
MNASAAPEMSAIMAAISQAKPYCLALLIEGPNFATTGDLHPAHLQHIFKLRASGAQLITLPVMEPNRIRGLALFSSADKDEVLRLMTEDPAVQAGRFVVEVLSVMGMPGDSVK